MIKNNLSIDEVKKKIIELKGQEVKLYVNRGRRKVFRFDAVVEDVYSSVFTVKLSEQPLVITVFEVEFVKLAMAFSCFFLMNFSCSAKTR